MANYKITTPHAAIKIWNYVDRIGLSGVSDLNSISETIISTVSCISIQTSKTKGEPVGSFSFVLAPTKDWISDITPGSWCVILMSNEPITKSQLDKADPKFVKMVGKIEAVSAAVTVDEEGARQTRYVVTGVDWGHIFNNTIYVDNLIAANEDPASQGNTIATMLDNMQVADGYAAKLNVTTDLILILLNLFGHNPQSINEAAKELSRIGKPSYDFLIPNEMMRYFGFTDDNGDATNLLTEIINVIDGRLTSKDNYQSTNEAKGFIDPYSIQGSNTFWQILLDNSNPTLNEMYPEMRWDGGQPSLTLYNRIKPFSFKSPNLYNFLATTNDAKNISAAKNSSSDTSSSDVADSLRSPFYLVKTHNIDPVTVMSVKAGTNWRDKYNFIEIRPQFTDFNTIGQFTANKVQGFDKSNLTFNREGFRPLFFTTKQLPAKNGDPSFFPEIITAWVQLLKEWYFDTHKLLNGTIILRGLTEYIPVGDNIRFEAGLLNPTQNLSAGAVKNKGTNYILAHVESVENNFSVTPDGARMYVTTIQFVRGIIVNKDNTLVGEGSLDTLSSSQLQANYKNRVNTIGTSDDSDPDPDKLEGT